MDLNKPEDIVRPNWENYHL